MVQITLFCSMLAGTGATVDASAQQPILRPQIFRLGNFDGSSREFSPGVPTAKVRVRADDAMSARQWYAFQPESVTRPSASASLGAAQRSVVFSIVGSPAPFYTVHASLLIEHASVPGLHVAVNGHEGTFYLDPKLDSRMGDGDAVSFPSYSQASVCFEVPGSFLHTGENEIVFSAVPQTAGKQLPDAGFNYDAIEMNEGKPQDRAIAVHIVPTVFYKRIANGLQEGLDVTVRSDGLPIQNVTLIVNGAKLPVTAPADGAWGERRSRVYVATFEPHTRVHVEWERGGRKEATDLMLEPAKRWTVYVVPHVHLDLGYTDYQAKVAAVQARIVDEALDLIDLHPEFRFSMDGMWSFEQFLENRTPADKARALAAMKSGKFFVPVQYNNELTGFASTETLIRSLYAGAQFGLKHGTPLNYVNITDVPSYTWSYASILAAAGIHDFVAGANNGRAPVLLRGHLNEISPFYWQGPDGQKVLFWYALHYHQLWTIFGLPPLMTAGEETLPLFLQTFGRPTYKASSTILYGSQVENTDLYPGQAEIAEEWNKQYAFPHLVYSGFYQALNAVAEEFKGNIPTIRGDGGPYWEDGIASDAYYAAMERETEARGLSAEKLATISSLVNPRIAVDKTSFDEMWRNMVLMDEHTWTSAESFSDSESDEATVQLAVKDSRAVRAHQLNDMLLRQSMAELADSIQTPANSLVVYNTLNWKRSGEISLDIRNGFEIVDSITGEPIPSEVTHRGENTSRTNFWAEDIPALGYKTYRLIYKPTERQIVPATSEAMENQFYRLILDPKTGAVRSVFDKQLGRELVDAGSPYRLGEYLYVTTNNAARGPSRYVVHGATGGKLISIERTPDGITAHLESTDVNTPRIVTSITLSSHEKKITFTEDVDKTATKDDEAVYFDFPFAMSHPQFQYEIQNGVVDPAKDMYPGASVDWFSVQHWASVQQDGVSATVMPLDASLMTFGDITRLNFPSTFGMRRGSIFSYAMNNYWHVNYRAEQGGHFQFRYVVTSSGVTNAVDLSRKGWEAFTPLEVSEVTFSDKAVETKRPLDGKSGSFLDVSDPALVLETWKAAEDGRGTILRFLDLGGAARTVRIGLPHSVLEHAWITDALERDQKELAITDPHALHIAITPHAIVTVRIQTKVTELRPCGRYCPDELSDTVHADPQ
jgi:hypothetical protein